MYMFKRQTDNKRKNTEKSLTYDNSSKLNVLGYS